MTPDVTAPAEQPTQMADVAALVEEAARQDFPGHIWANFTEAHRDRFRAAVRPTVELVLARLGVSDAD